jgi:predicted hotdog family 3-hydroxylacyl-ACP dehydratase
VSDFAGLLPHTGHAVMLEEILSWDEHDLRARTRAHRAPDNPLRHDGRLAAVHLVEFGAQAMASHGALRARAAGHSPASALLVAVRQFEATRTFIDDLEDALEVHARQLLAAPTGWQYEFEVSHQHQMIARGRVAALVYPVPAFRAAVGNSND